MKIRSELSLFNGMGCGRIALGQLGIECEKHYSSEIEKKPIEIVQHNYPDTIQLGDINNWREWNINWSTIDLIMAGSPCQGFSIVGSRLNFDDPRSKLFFVFIDILNHVRKLNPGVRFLLENVKMRKDCQAIISAFTRVEPVNINSSKFTAQERQRLYWFNWDIAEIVDKNILFSGVIDWKKDRWFNILPWSLKEWGGKLKVDSLRTCINKKSFTLTTSKSHPHNHYLNADRTMMTKLTAEEAEILQGVPSGFTSCVAKTHAFKALGNGWNIPTIKHILSTMDTAKPTRQVDVVLDQLEFSFE